MNTEKLKNLQHQPNCVSTLPNTNTAHFETTVVWPTASSSIQLVVRNFRKKLSDVHLFNF